MDSSAPVYHLIGTSRTRNKTAMFRGEHSERIGIFECIASLELRDAVLKQRQHETCTGGDQRSQRRKAKFTRELGVDDFAFIRIRIDAVACDLDFVVVALAIHLRVDAKASCARENLQGFFKPLVFVVGKIAKMRQPETFLDDYSEEVIALWANLNYSPQLRRA